jgi:hypothetical protein
MRHLNAIGKLAILVNSLEFAMRISTIGFLVIILLAMTQTTLALIITSPKDGSTFKVGDTVKLVAELTPGSQDDLKIGFVDFFFSKGFNPHCPEEISTHPRYECSFTIPVGSPRAVRISAVGETVDGAISAPEIAINILLSSSVVLQDLKSFTGNKLYLVRLGQNAQLYITGTYSDGIEREHWLASTGTTYLSSNDKIATVNADGLVTAIAAGNAQITVSNGSKKLVVNVIVKPKQ